MAGSIAGSLGLVDRRAVGIRESRGRAPPWGDMGTGPFPITRERPIIGSPPCGPNGPRLPMTPRPSSAIPPTGNHSPAAWLDAVLVRGLDEEPRAWLKASVERVEGGLVGPAFGGLLSVASRHAPREGLRPRPNDLSAASVQLPGWNPERWDTLEAMRIRLLLARPDLREASFASDLEDACRHGDEGELRAFYKGLGLLPEGGRFVLRAAEGCRTNVVPVFEAVACDSPFPYRHFDDIAWNQMVIKALFIGAPVPRIWGLDRRNNPELARMALDLVDERRSAGRAVQPELWLCLGSHAGERGKQAALLELTDPHSSGHAGALFALARAGEMESIPHIPQDNSDGLAALALISAGTTQRLDYLRLQESVGVASSS